MNTPPGKAGGFKLWLQAGSVRPSTDDTVLTLGQTICAGKKGVLQVDKQLLRVCIDFSLLKMRECNGTDELGVTSFYELDESFDLEGYGSTSHFALSGPGFDDKGIYLIFAGKLVKSGSK